MLSFVLVFLCDIVVAWVRGGRDLTACICSNTIELELIIVGNLSRNGRKNDMI